MSVVLRWSISVDVDEDDVSGTLRSRARLRRGDQELLVNEEVKGRNVDPGAAAETLACLAAARAVAALASKIEQIAWQEIRPRGSRRGCA